MTTSLLSLYDLHTSPPDDVLYPTFDSDWNLKLDANETVVWNGKVSDVTFGGKGLKRWELRGVDVTITNQRIVYVCHKFTKGQAWWGVGGLGVMFAILMRIITAAVAAYQRQGKAAVGQIRYQWPRAIIHQTWKKTDLFGNANTIAIMVAVEQQPNPVMLKFGMAKEPCDEMSNVLLQNLAHFRVSRDFTPEKFPNDDPKQINEVKSQLFERLTKKVKSDETDAKIVDYYEISKSSLPVPKLA